MAAQPNSHTNTSTKAARSRTLLIGFDEPQTSSAIMGARGPGINNMKAVAGAGQAIIQWGDGGGPNEKSASKYLLLATVFAGKINNPRAPPATTGSVPPS